MTGFPDSQDSIMTCMRERLASKGVMLNITMFLHAQISTIQAEMLELATQARKALHIFSLGNLLHFPCHQAIARPCWMWYCYPKDGYCSIRWVSPKQMIERLRADHLQSLLDFRSSCIQNRLIKARKSSFIDFPALERILLKKKLLHCCEKRAIAQGKDRMILPDWGKAN